MKKLYFNQKKNHCSSFRELYGLTRSQMFTILLLLFSVFSFAQDVYDAHVKLTVNGTTKEYYTSKNGCSDAPDGNLDGRTFTGVRPGATITFKSTQTDVSFNPNGVTDLRMLVRTLFREGVDPYPTTFAKSVNLSNTNSGNFGCGGSGGSNRSELNGDQSITLPSVGGTYTVEYQISNTSNTDVKAWAKFYLVVDSEPIYFVDGSGTEHLLSTNDEVTYTAQNITINSTASSYFKNGAGTESWGNTTWVSGNTTTKYTTSPATVKITSMATGKYSLSFNKTTRVFTFTLDVTAVQKIKTAKVNMQVNGTSYWYNLLGAQPTTTCHINGGERGDFNRDNSEFTETVTKNSTLKIGGEALTNNINVDKAIPVVMHYRYYLDGDTPGAYTTRVLDYTSNMPAAGCNDTGGTNGAQFLKTASSGSTITLSTAGNYIVEVYFQAGGSTTGRDATYRNGYSTSTWNVTGNHASLSNWGATGYYMAVVPNSNWKHLYDFPMPGVDFKFNTGGTTGTWKGAGGAFPSGTANGASNITATAATYAVAYNSSTDAYSFSTPLAATYYNNATGANYKARIKVVDITDNTNKDTSDGSFGFTDGTTDPGCTQCTGLYESYMGLLILDAQGAIVANKVYNLDGAYGSANTSNLYLGSHYPGVNFKIGLEVKAWAKGKHKMCGCSSWFYVYDKAGTPPTASDFPLPASGSEYTSQKNGLFTLMNSSKAISGVSHTPIPLNNVNTSGNGSGAFTSTVNTGTALGLAYQNLIKGFNIQGYNHTGTAPHPPASTYSIYFNGSTVDQYFTNVNGFDNSSGGTYGANERMIYDRYITAAEAASWFKIRQNGGWTGANWGGPWTFPNSNAVSPGANITSPAEGNYTILFNISSGSLMFSTTTLYRWKDFTNGATTTSVNTPVNLVSCPTCGGSYYVAVAGLCWASSTGNCSDATSYYYHRDINQNKVHNGVALNPHHPNSIDLPPNSPGNTIKGHEYFYTQEINIIDNGAPNTWNGTTWSVTGATLPQSYHDVFVNSNLTIPAGQGFSCINLTVADGVTITLNDDSYIEVLRAATTLGSGATKAKIVVPSSANFVQRCDLQSSTANIVHTKKTRLLAQYDYAYLSSPIVENAIPMVETAGMGRMFEWTSGAAGGWTTISTTVNKSGKGFIAWSKSPNIKVSSNIFAGTAKNGVVSTAVSNVDSDVTKSSNYALLGNPYPCAVNGELFLTHANNAHISGTLYYWSSNSRLKDGSASGYGDYNAKDYNPADYASWNLAAGTGTAASSTRDTTNDTIVGNNVAPTKFIPSGTGFFVRVLSPGNAYFNNSMRSTTTNLATSYRKNDTEELKKSRVWLNISNGKGAFKQMAIAYMRGATTKGLDRLLDSENYSVSKAVIYTINDGNKLAIEGRPEELLDANETLPLGIDVKNQDDYQISLDNFDGDFDKKWIYLNDKVSDTIHKLSDKPYIFKTNSGVYDDRFELIIRDKERKPEPVFSDSDEISDLTLRIADGINGIEIIKEKDLINKVEFYSTLGSKIATRNFDPSSKVVISDVKRMNQVIIVKVTFEDGHTATRKILY